MVEEMANCASFVDEFVVIEVVSHPKSPQSHQSQNSISEGPQGPVRWMDMAGRIRRIRGSSKPESVRYGGARRSKWGRSCEFSNRSPCRSQPKEPHEAWLKMCQSWSFKLPKRCVVVVAKSGTPPPKLFLVVWQLRSRGYQNRKGNDCSAALESLCYQ